MNIFLHLQLQYMNRIFLESLLKYVPNSTKITSSKWILNPLSLLGGGCTPPLLEDFFLITPERLGVLAWNFALVTNFLIPIFWYKKIFKYHSRGSPAGCMKSGVKAVQNKKLNWEANCYPIIMKLCQIIDFDKRNIHNGAIWEQTL